MKLTLQQIQSKIPTIQYFTIGLITGITAAVYYPFPIAVSISALGIGSLFLAYRRSNRTLIGTMLCFFLGLLSFQIQETAYTKAAQDLSGYKATLTGKVSTVEHIKNKFSYRSTIQIANHNIWILSKELPRFKPGDTVELKSIFLHSPLEKEMETWMRKENIIATAFTGKIRGIILKRHHTFDIWSYLNRKKESFFTNLQQKLPDHVGNLMGLIFFGNKQEIDPNELMELRTTYMHWGLSHYLARSGLHIVILFALLNLLLSLFGIPNRERRILLLAFCLLYTALSWMSISYLRALILIVLYNVAKLTKIKVSMLHLINLTCCIILLYNPHQLLALDFQLSFALTYILILMGQLKKQPTKFVPAKN
ncbi:MAG TPA: ComEC/Rec2 family competence protein [Candidatus Babeliales bacterium]|nr:ComEC/Rec2 family competence protein [Candidatus Babeliales bacterium]